MTATTGSLGEQTLAGLLPNLMAAHVVSLAVQWGLPDTIGADETTAETIASAHGVPTQRMIRLIRAFVHIGLAEERGPGVFALTEAGTLLRSDVPGSLRGHVLLTSGPVTMDSWRHLEPALRDGGAGFEHAYGMHVFDYLAARPELSEEYNRMMSSMSAGVAEDVARHYDFGRFGSVTDVAGGNGTLLGAILRRHPSLTGVLFDSETGTEQAPERLASAGVSRRCTITNGDFFAAVPTGSEVYLLKSIVADWDDERATVILRNCRAAMPAHGRLLIIEMVLPETANPGGPGQAHLLDLHLMAIYGGAVRGRADFERLFADAGLRLTGVHPLPETATPRNGISIVEAAPA